MRKKIAFIKKGAFSHTNTSVGQLLVKYFPEYDVEFIDVSQIIVEKRSKRWANYASILRHYGLDILLERRSVWDCFYHTPYAFDEIKAFVQEKIGPRKDEYAFTFQTQSLYDASVPGLPHFVYTDHTNLANLHYNGFGDSKVFPKWNSLEKTIYQNATRVFTMSEHVKRSVIEQYGCDGGKIACVLAGCNVELKHVPLENDNYRNKHILFVGIEWERKGGPLLVDAFKQVLKKHPDAHLTIVGSAPDVNVPNCNVIGAVPLEQVRSFYPKASVFCLPTRLEPFGIVFIEAMLYRIPIVGPRIGALPDFIEDGKTGRLVAPNNVDELAAALIDLLDNPDKSRQLAEAGHIAVKDRYTWEAVGARIRAAVDATLKEQPSRVNCAS